jgi:hypothetical protein
MMILGIRHTEAYDTSRSTTYFLHTLIDPQMTILGISTNSTSNCIQVMGKRKQAEKSAGGRQTTSFKDILQEGKKTTYAASRLRRGSAAIAVHKYNRLLSPLGRK